MRRAGFACVLALLASAAPLARAQRPTAEQAQAILQARPDLVEQLRKRLVDSGLTPDQIRARLRAEGYPENLLDAYLPGSTVAPDAAGRDRVLQAMRTLGIADSNDLAQLVQRNRSGAPGDTTGLELLSDDATNLGMRSGRDTVELRQRADSGFTLFGYALFRGPPTQFQPNLAGPVDANYRLGPGDRLVLILTGDVELSHDLQVTREGFIIIPQVGQLFVNSLTLGQLEALLQARLSRVYSGIRREGGTTRFAVSVAGIRSLAVFVVGDVERPGSYRIASTGTAFSALYAAGGPTRSGSLRRIEIRRNGKLVDVLDAYAYLLRGDASHDVRLETGDVVFVAPHGPRVRLVGEVVRPGTYEMAAGETVGDAVRMAGGLTGEGDARRVMVERTLPVAERGATGRDRVVLSLALDAAGTVAAGAGDVVRVGGISDRVRNRVVVRGNVYSPGLVALEPGMKLSDALRRAGGLRPDTYLGRVLVSRLRPDSVRIQLRATLRDTTGTAVDDLVLREDDEVRVFSLTEFRPLRFVSIAGAVRKGGRFPYREGMTMRDLVLLAGGLDQSAFLSEAEIARLPESRAGGVSAVTVRVPLDSTYLAERTADARYLGPPGLPAPAGAAPEVTLNPYDYVLILRQPDWSLQRAVWVTGEVKFPGRYTLRNQAERLSDVITRAGGVTTLAYADGSSFFRTRDSVGRVGISLSRALRDPQNIDNLVLQDGDSLSIPQLNPVVVVRGEVNAATGVAYRAGADIDYYVKAAGGARRNGDARRAYVTQMNGSVESRVPRLLFLPDGKPEPLPGATVTVPMKDLNEELQDTQKLTAWLGILTSLATLAILVRSKI
jgi:protein involved in polysaccharide export with SLBB domain